VVLERVQALNSWFLITRDLKDFIPLLKLRRDAIKHVLGRRTAHAFKNFLESSAQSSPPQNLTTGEVMFLTTRCQSVQILFELLILEKGGVTALSEQICIGLRGKLNSRTLRRIALKFLQFGHVELPTKRRLPESDITLIHDEGMIIFF